MTQAPGWAGNTDTFYFRARAPRPRPAQKTDKVHVGRHHADEHAEAWNSRIVATIAREVRSWREHRGLSAQHLAARCEDLGYPIHRNIIANLENGRRGTVTVSELVILALALNVPPAILVYPIDRMKMVAAAPKQEVAPWKAVKWFVGLWRPEGNMLARSPGQALASAVEEWEGAYEIFVLYERHDVLVGRYKVARDDTIAELRRLAEPSASDLVANDRVQERQKLLGGRIEGAVRALQAHRQRMREWGCLPPELPFDIGTEI